jgi:hypothetical protein
MFSRFPFENVQLFQKERDIVVRERDCLCQHPVSFLFRQSLHVIQHPDKGFFQINMIIFQSVAAKRLIYHNLNSSIAIINLLKIAAGALRKSFKTLPKVLVLH